MFPVPLVGSVSCASGQFCFISFRSAGVSCVVSWVRSGQTWSCPVRSCSCRAAVVWCNWSLMVIFAFLVLQAVRFLLVVVAAPDRGEPVRCAGSEVRGAFHHPSGWD